MTFLPRLKLPAFFVRFLTWCFPIQGVGALLIQEVNRSVLLRSLFQLLLLLQHLYPHWLFLCYLGRLLSLTQWQNSALTTSSQFLLSGFPLLRFLGVLCTRAFVPWSTPCRLSPLILEFAFSGLGSSSRRYVFLEVGLFGVVLTSSYLGVLWFVNGHFLLYAGHLLILPIARFWWLCRRDSHVFPSPCLTSFLISDSLYELLQVCPEFFFNEWWLEDSACSFLWFVSLTPTDSLVIPEKPLPLGYNLVLQTFLIAYLDDLFHILLPLFLLMGGLLHVLCLSCFFASLSQFPLTAHLYMALTGIFTSLPCYYPCTSTGAF